MTGAGGFVGAVLVRRLLAAGDSVTALVRPGGATWRLEGLEGDVRLVEADLRDERAVRRAIREARPERVFHLGAHGGSSWETDRRAIVETNLLGTLNVLDAAEEAGAGAVVHAGSSSEYGFKRSAPAEDSPLEPASDYAVAKAAATLLCSERGREGGLPVATLRLYSVYGPYEEPRRLVPTLVVRGLEGALPPLVSPGVARDFVFVDDVCEAFLLAAEQAGERPGSVWNVGTGAQTTVADLVELAREVLGIEAEPAWGSMPDRSWDTAAWVADPARARAELGWEPRTTLADGFARTVEWLSASPLLESVYRPAIADTGSPGSRSARA